MKKIILIIVTLCIGLVIGFTVASASSINVERDSFYRGMIAFCEAAPDKSGYEIYTSDECATLILRAMKLDYYHATPTP